MRKILLIVLTGIIVTACKKETVDKPTPGLPQPQMRYKDLKDVVVKYQQTQTLDIDNDGTMDFYLGVQLVGDPVLQQDKKQFLMNSTVKRNLLNNEQDQSPMLNKFDQVSKNHPGYTWWEISSIVLAEKITEMNGNSYWQGLWKNASHNYMPLQIEKNGKLYHGWLEVSFDTTGEKLILHRSAISLEEDIPVQAGV